MCYSPSLMLRRLHFSSSSVRCFSSSVVKSSSKKKQLVFLGSPQVAASVLADLLNASSALNSLFEVAAIVTQPPSARDRGRKVTPSPVAQQAIDRGFPSDLIFTPEKAGDETFLSSLRALQPELCITAAYGNILPTKFLKIPSLGTVNIHPSLLPLYRGAAPVQRALEDGVQETGVSLAFTVRALDAGPIIASERVEVNDEIKAPELLTVLFSQGSKLLIRELPSIFDGSARTKAIAQDDSRATLAPKISPEESWLSFDQEALVLHNKVRAFSGWPGTRARVAVVDDKNVQQNILELKVITTRVGSTGNNRDHEEDYVTFSNGALVFPCGGGTSLEVRSSFSTVLVKAINKLVLKLSLFFCVMVVVVVRMNSRGNVLKREYVSMCMVSMVMLTDAGGSAPREESCKCSRLLEWVTRTAAEEVITNGGKVHN